MTDTQFDQIIAAIKSLNDTLAARSAAPATAPKRDYTAPDRNEVIPPPSVLVDDPGSVEITFGKNKGVRLSDLAPASLRFYAGSGWVLREKSTGGFWPGDEALKNAARQYWHLKHADGSKDAFTGKDATWKPKAEPTEMQLSNQAPGAPDESVPF